MHETPNVETKCVQRRQDWVLVRRGIEGVWSGEKGAELVQYMRREETSRGGRREAALKRQSRENREQKSRGGEEEGEKIDKERGEMRGGLRW